MCAVGLRIAFNQPCSKASAAEALAVGNSRDELAGAHSVWLARVDTVCEGVDTCGGDNIGVAGCNGNVPVATQHSTGNAGSQVKRSFPRLSNAAAFLSPFLTRGSGDLGKLMNFELDRDQLNKPLTQTNVTNKYRPRLDAHHCWSTIWLNLATQSVDVFA